MSRLPVYPFACRADRVGNEHGSRHPCGDGRNTGAGPDPVAPSRIYRNECKPSPCPGLGSSIGSLSGRRCRGRRIFRPIFCTVAVRAGEAFFVDTFLFLYSWRRSGHVFECLSTFVFSFLWWKPAISCYVFSLYFFKVSSSTKGTPPDAVDTFFVLVMCDGDFSSYLMRRSNASSLFVDSAERWQHPVPPWASGTVELLMPQGWRWLC